MDERQLVDQAKAGQRIAFERLVRLHQQKVYAVALGILRDKAEAQDVAQDAFLRAYKHLARFSGTSFYAWLYRITVNLCYSRLRTRMHGHVPLDDRVPEPLDRTFSPELALGNNELRETLQRALSALPRPLRAVLLLREVDHLSYEELAQALGWPQGTVMSRLHQARKRLQEVLR